MDDSTRINADFDRVVIERPEQAVWVDSPLPGVTRRMLDRVGGEVARATSLVRYAPNSRFDPHVHGGGEEILVLDGVFGDEAGHYPAGSYLRNPRGSRHAPYSGPGCLLLVKLHQFAADDAVQICHDTGTGDWEPGDAPGIERQWLHRHGREQVTLERWRAGSSVDRMAPPGGEELFVIEGELGEAAARYPAGTWLRNPAGTPRALTSTAGCKLYRKTGHLPP